MEKMRATRNNMKYSVVMSVYAKDNPEWLKQAIDSLLNQTIQPDEIVIVEDGPLTLQLNVVMSQYKNSRIISIVRLKKNQGLGNALNIGIEYAKNELIGRMDSDDIAIPNRFQLQLAEFEKHSDLDILGGQIAEFVDNPEETIGCRKVPTTPFEIKQFAHRRSPFNHPTVMYKKSVIQQLGGYDASIIRLEDYDLWLRAIAKGAVCANIDDIILKYRSTTDAVKRRKTFTSLKNHIRARIQFHKRGYISLVDLGYGLVTQIVLFMMPAKLAEIIFKKVVRE